METESTKQLSTEQLDQLLKERKKKELAEKEAQRKAYEAKRDKLVQLMLSQAQDLSHRMEGFKKTVHSLMDDQERALLEYGQIRSNSKGGFSITNSEGNLRVTRRRDTEPYWDERGTKALGLIKEFLQDTVKKKDIKLFEILMTFLERNKAGELEYARVFGLLAHEDKFDDARWVEGLQLLRESYSVTVKGYAYEFKVRGEDGKWENVGLNFSGL